MYELVYCFFTEKGMYEYTNYLY